MILIIGGVYQGKLRYARETWNVPEEQVFTCTGTEIDFTMPCIDHIEDFVLASVRSGQDAAACFGEHRDEWKDSVLICQDITCGVVPMGADMRQWRDATGRLCQYLAAEADTVIRMFCGLPQKLK